ncbi:intermediate filament tail domain protein [Ostertagia ostertagi]
MAATAEWKMVTTAEWNESQRIRQAENHEIGTLNERHADIISNVHFLQARRRKLEMIIGQWSGSAWTHKPEYSYVMKSSRYEAEAAQLPSLKQQLSTAESRFEAARREHVRLDEDDLLTKLCEIRMKLCIAEGRGKRIDEECRRLRLENQKILEDQAAQRLIIDREVVDRSAYERRATDLLAECESLLESCRIQGVRSYSFDDIESDRKLFRGAIDSAMVDIRRQYENLASTVNTEMKQWYDQRITQVALASTVNTEMKQWYDQRITQVAERLALLRAELIDVRTKLNNLENRNRLLESLIADIEEAKAADLMVADTLSKEDQLQLKSLMEQYEAVTGGAPMESKYSIASLREEILRYRELLYGIGSGIISDGPSASGALSIVHHRSSSHEIGSGVSAYRVQRSQAYGAINHSRSGSGAYSQSGGGATYTQIRSSTVKHSQNGSYSSKEYRIGGGVTTGQSQIGSGVSTGYSQMGSGAGQYSSQIGYGATTQDIGSGVVQKGERYAISSSTTTPTVVSKLDYMIKGAADDLNTSRISSEHDYAMHRSAQGNVAIAEVAADGSYIILENTSLDCDQHLGEWTLRSTSSTLKQVSYTFPRDFTLTPQNTVQIFARGRGVHNPPHSLVCESDSTFATGDDLSVYLYDNNGQERAHLSQRSFFRHSTSF